MGLKKIWIGLKARKMLAYVEEIRKHTVQVDEKYKPRLVQEGLKKLGSLEEVAKCAEYFIDKKRYGDAEEILDTYFVLRKYIREREA
jgi:hypothetical protein